jgi:hypothetical protein
VKHRKFLGIHFFGNADVIRSLDAEENFQRKVPEKRIRSHCSCRKQKIQFNSMFSQEWRGRWRNDSRGTALSFLSCDFAFL